MFQSRHLDSSFFGHARHSDLIEQFSMATKDLDPYKLYQISMDGPKVNVKFYEEIVKSQEKAMLHTLINIGSCSLHVVHGSLKTGINKSNIRT